MSTLKTTHLQHPSSGSPNLTLAADGSVSGGAGLGGLVHIHTEEFTAVSSVSLDDVFSAEYDNYSVVYGANCTAGGSLLARLRASSTDETSANYDFQYLRAINTSINTGRTSSSTYGSFGNTRSGAYNNGVVDLFQPFLSPVRTSWVINHQDWEPAIQIFRTGFAGNGSYDGFTMYPSSGTITGSVSVYGYAKS